MIDPITGAALGEALGAVTGQMAGQTLADAYNQHMTDTRQDNRIYAICRLERKNKFKQAGHSGAPPSARQ